MRIIGLMSGTSVDGIDAALVSLTGAPPQLHCTLECFLTIPWTAEQRALILGCCRPDAPLQEVLALDVYLGECFAEAVHRLLARAGLRTQDIDAIASHGQTLWHQPVPLYRDAHFLTGTFQAGEPAIIAARTDRVVVADFRVSDMACGGQGAPLVPFADYVLFHSETENRAVQNLGGIANVTFLPAGGKPEDTLAFDTGPGNLLLDAITERISNGAQQYDPNGALAASGQIIPSLLAELLMHPYFRAAPPKSTGREEFGAEYAQSLFQRANRAAYRPTDLLATLTALTAETIARAYRDFLPAMPQTVLLGGGGVHNATLVREISERLAPTRVATHAEFGLSDDAKEAVAFAILAYETLHGRPSSIPTATGACRPAILGKIVSP
jgi:anhydro-N-acetylmuramic acid kinase